MSSGGGAEPEPEAEAEVTASSSEPENGNQSNIIPEIMAEVRPEVEPGPNWSVAFFTLGESWPLHNYVFAVLFLMICVHAVLNLSKIKRKEIRKRSLTISMNVTLVILGVTRAFILLSNPYNAKNVLPSMVVHTTWALGFPCITSSFSLMLLVLQDTTKTTFGPPRFQRFSTISAFMAFHFILVMSTEMIMLVKLNVTKIMLVVCQTLFVLWSFLTTVGYVIVGKKIRSNFSATLDNKWAKNDDGECEKIRRLTKLMYICVVVGLAITVTHLYGAFGVFGVYSDVKFVDTWPWWAFQTLMRTEEILISALIFTMAAKIPSSDQKGLLRFANVIRRIIPLIIKKETKVGVQHETIEINFMKTSATATEA